MPFLQFPRDGCYPETPNENRRRSWMGEYIKITIIITYTIFLIIEQDFKHMYNSTQQTEKPIILLILRERGSSWKLEICFDKSAFS